MKSIIDVSSVIYGGHYGNERRVRGFPIGGIRKLFGIINAGLCSSDFALCFDGGATIKKELLPTYKAGRVPDYSVLAQLDLCKELLTDCNIDFHCIPGYEADDLIFSLCQIKEVIGDIEVTVIYTDDRDLSCCVTNTNSIKCVTTNGACISMDSYSDRVVRDCRIPYNTVLLWKTFHGDNSDEYRALHIPGITFESISHEFISTLSPLIRPGGFTQIAYADYDVFASFMSDYGLPDADKDKLLKQARIAFPFKVDVMDIPLNEFGNKLRDTPLYVLERKHLKFFGLDSINKRKFENYCALLGIGRKFIDRDSSESQAFYNLLELRAKALSNGEFAVKVSSGKKIVTSHAPTLDDMELPI